MHGGNLEGLKLNCFSGELRVLEGCPRLKGLGLLLHKINLYPDVFVTDKPHEHLSKICITFTCSAGIGSCMKERKTARGKGRVMVEDVFEDLDLSTLVGLKEVKTNAVWWPTTDKQTKKNACYWPGISDKYAKRGLRLVDEEGVHWVPRMSARK
ncbi:hypothetical protein BDV98DRAFT_119220 [Pterulicium gracile]|uniref:F-box domain-containing protein n=1 Tax=Pterulicium gracile TaxID=1884261 RepID=A0A5C3QDE8_9AGAR|nr:hypothetical protein BDV98DRAFT_119220 [Pterula gracilis]